MIKKCPMKKKFIVRFRVDCRQNVEVEAEDMEKAIEAAKEAFMDADLSDAEYVDADPVSVEDEDGELHDLI